MKKLVLFSFAGFVVAAAATAQTNLVIENSYTVHILDDTVVSDVYVGNHTWDNTLIMGPHPDLVNSNNLTFVSDNVYIGATDFASRNTVDIQLSNSVWTVANMYLGTTNNISNELRIRDHATVEIAGDLEIGLIGNFIQVFDNGTLFMNRDFEFTSNGILLEPGGILKVGGEFTGLESIENDLTISLSGPGASWALNTNTLHIGATTDDNKLVIEDGADVTLENINVGAAGTSGNELEVISDSRLHLTGDLLIAAGNSGAVKDGGGLEIDGDFDANGFELLANGTLIGHGAVSNLPAVDGGNSSLLIAGPNAITDQGGLSFNIGGTTDGNTFSITSNGYFRINDFTLGSATNAGNKIDLTEGGTLVLASSGSSYISAENELNLTDGGRLVIEGDYAIDGDSDGYFYWGNGGILEVQGEMAIFTNTLVDDAYVIKSIDGLLPDSQAINFGQGLIISGPSGEWDLAGNGLDLHVGDLTGGNLFGVTNGAYVSALRFTVGDFAESGGGNTVIISGAGSELMASGDIEIGGRSLLDDAIDSPVTIGGTWTEGSANNRVRVEDGATMFAGGSLRVGGDNSGLEIGMGSTVSAAHYYQSSNAYVRFEVNNTPTNMGRLVTTTPFGATFEKGAEIGFYTKASDLAIDAVYTNTLVEASQLVAGGITNPTTVELNETLDLDQSRGLVDYEILVQTNGGNHDIIVLLDRTLIGRSAGFDPGSMMWNVAGTIDALSLNSNNTAAINQVNILNGMTSAQQNQQLTQLYATSLPVYMHNSGVLRGIDQIRARGATFRGKPAATSAAQPAGVAGPSPHSGEQGLQGWVKAYGAFGNRDSDDTTALADGYSMSAFGTVVGFDRSFSQWLFGIAGGYAHSGLKGDNDDTSTADTGYGVLYTTYGTNTWFVDFSASFGVSSIENESGTAFDATSDTSAQQSAFYLGLGYEFEDKESDAKLRPLMGVQFHNFSQDAYAYSLMNVDAYDRQSIQSIIGTSLMIPKAGTKVDWESDFRAFWLHEFNDDVDSISYTMAGPGTPGQMIIRSPDSDVGQFGVGLTANWRNGWQAKLDLDGQVSKTFYSATISGAILREF